MAGVPGDEFDDDGSIPPETNTLVILQVPIDQLVPHRGLQLPVPGPLAFDNDRDSVNLVASSS